MAGIILEGSRLVKEGDLTIGEIMAFLLFMVQLIANFAVVALAIVGFYSMLGAQQSMIDMMQKKPGIPSKGGNQLGNVAGEIEFKNVYFEYPSKKDVKILKGLSLKVKENQVVALVGQSGCGKSSIISLIERFYDPTQGQVEFSGEDIRTLDPKWYKTQIALVS